MPIYVIFILVIIMKILIDEVLKAQNRTRYWLAKETGITRLNVSNLCEQKTSSIRFEVLERICEALNCEPGDILKIKDESK